MLIDTYHEDWLTDLHERASQLDEHAQIYLLIDGVFVPGLYRQVRKAVPAMEMTLLFETLPSCSDKVRDVSPFLVRYDATLSGLEKILGHCSGSPMVSAVETKETLEQLTERLAAWCVIYSDGQRFNFRFPDTRRLPGIFSALRADQRAQLAGPATRWAYIDREGGWKELPVPMLDGPVAQGRPELDDGQFGMMVSDNEVESMLVRISRRQHLPDAKPSHLHATISQALRIAETQTLDDNLLIDWCEECLIHSVLPDEIVMAKRMIEWRHSVAAIE
ncbi:DUF4123 domain-containing protein [Duganella violaceipulchra]|uniref:DUF4123 domain-containing protein n=1 Tax=Duganella violaceipulchra TaxID=2849652 RepID=A0AA41L0R0_9BURK|nr:DUF4123 domain-containing protein [Duganella violaceicalia]MBV6319303.1 DUF4123 domain-containing protein [Duganella violaceicalia]MCP2006890.1 hypothetical protein [Duganella violaceicalia]